MVGVVAGLVTWLAAADIGGVVVGRIRPGLARTTRLALGAALGYAVLGALVGLLAVAHLLQAPIVTGIPFFVLVTRIPNYVKRRHTVRASIGALLREIGNQPFDTRCAMAVAGFAVLTAVVAAALPAVWWDPIAYHLPIAARALATGTLSFDPAMTQTGFPLLGEAAALPAYALGGSAGAAMATLGSGVVLIMLCAAIARAYQPNAAWLSAALIAATPLWVWLAPSFYVDIPFAMFAVAAIGAALVVPAAANQQMWVGALAGALAGSAAGVKLPGVGIAAVAAIALLASYRRKRQPALAAFALASALAGLPWYLRSAALTGDPFYPFLTPWLGHGARLVSFAGRYATMTRTWCGAGYGLVDALSMPWRALSDPRQYCGDPGFAVRAGIVLVAAAAVTVRRTRPLALIIVALTALWFSESHQWRFLIPALTFCAVAIAVAAFTISDRLARPLSLGLLVLSAVNVLANWLPALENLASNSLTPAYSYITGRESAGAYLDSRLESIAASTWLAARLSRSDKIYALDDVRDYYLGEAAVWGNPFYQPVWSIDWQVPPARRYARLAAAGFRYMVVNDNKAYVSRTPTGVDWQVLRADESRGVIRRVFSENDVIVYGIGAPR